MSPALPILDFLGFWAAGIAAVTTSGDLVLEFFFIFFHDSSI